MQLFITDFKLQNNKIIIENENNLHQIKNVLRLKIWDIFFVQNSWWKEIKRYKIEIENFWKTNLTWITLNTEISESSTNRVWMIVAIWNKRDKMELIVQKLSEIWVDQIVLRPSERSVIREVNNKKMERLNLISKEAVEQSRWRKLPEIKFVSDIENIVKNNQIIIFDKEIETLKNGKIEKWWSINFSNTDFPLFWVVWPEGWLTENDYKKFGWNYIVKNLWLTVLRMETACIVWAWLLKNLL